MWGGAHFDCVTPNSSGTRATSRLAVTALKLTVRLRGGTHDLLHTVACSIITSRHLRIARMNHTLRYLHITCRKELKSDQRRTKMRERGEPVLKLSASRRTYGQNDFLCVSPKQNMKRWVNRVFSTTVITSEKVNLHKLTGSVNRTKHIAHFIDAELLCLAQKIPRYWTLTTGSQISSECHTQLPSKRF
jgi:hypothetical protein